MIPKIKNTELNDVSREEFNRKCNEATKEIKLWLIRNYFYYILLKLKNNLIIN